MTRKAKALQAVRNWLIAPMFCMVLPLSIIVIGWIDRCITRPVDAAYPGLLLGGKGARWRDGVWANLVAGLVALRHAWAWTLLGGVLLLLGWDEGWQISFYKAYEVSWVGRTVSAIGIVALIWGLMYLPAAEARRLATGSTREALKPAELRRIMAVRPLSWAWLSMWQALIGAGVGFAMLLLLDMAKDVPSAEIIAQEGVMRGKGFVACLVLAMIGLKIRRWARLRGMALHEQAAQQLATAPDARANRLLRIIGFIWRLAAWTGFVLSVYVAQFIAYNWFLWLQHPALQAPWFNLIAPPMGG